MNDQIALLTREQLRLKLNERGYPLTASYFNKISLPSVNGRCTQRPFGNTIVSSRIISMGNRAGESIASALRQDLTPSPTARRAQAQSSVRARSACRGARVDQWWQT